MIIKPSITSYEYWHNVITSDCRQNVILKNDYNFSEEDCYITSSLYSNENKGEERGCRKVFN